ncbi:aldehyde dehydrogenase (NADP(+)) [Novosphingobium aerophilum]|nr:aldehyde dehydrogenase (NADP(+)) [Novosphingobium aerophilum]
MIVASRAVMGEGAPFSAARADTGLPLDRIYRAASAAQVDAAVAAADRAAIAFGDSAPADRASLLEAIAEAIAGTGDALIVQAMAETGLPRPRLEGERMRTANQLRLFAAVLRDGTFADIRIDRADPTRAAGPKPDLRLGMLALGPVAVFGASNFPLAFSVAGGDTASALAAGCPVVVKGHPAHPGTSEIVAAAVAQAVLASGFDPGIFSMLHDAGIAVGQQLVTDPRINAVGFTGSRRGGEALMALAAARPVPIPVYAEMSAINPVLLFPGRLAEAADEIGASFVASLTLGTGQFCTNPGLVIAIDGEPLDRFVAAAARALEAWGPGVMLHPGICSAYGEATATLARHEAVVAAGRGGSADLRATGQLFTTTSDAFLSHAELRHEMFGPASLVVRCRDLADVGRVLAQVEGQLTVALHFSEADHAAVAALLPVARRKAGRVLANGFGTGVEVSPAMVHGGPYPATSDGRTTSVGTLAIARFLRPVCLQDIPEELLPAALQEANPWSLPRRVWGGAG